MSDRETLRIIDRALWVDHGDGNLDGLTPELPVWADEWAERIVAAVNGRRVITDPAELDALPAGSVILAGDKARDFASHSRTGEALFHPALAWSPLPEDGEKP